MYSHIMVGANDIEESKKFYDSTLAVLGAEPGVLSVNPTGHKRYMTKFYFCINSVRTYFWKKLIKKTVSICFCA